MPRTPISRFMLLVWLDRGELILLGCYALASGLLALAVPLAAQALVNTIVQGLFLQPLLVLTAAVFLGLLLSGLLKALQMALAEGVQQRLFAKLGLRLSELLPQFQVGAFVKQRGPEELNKFFEIVNVQKAWNKLLLDVPAGTVEFLLSFAFLALYGPTLLSLSAVALGATFVVLLLLGYGGLRSSIRESYAKYDLAGWLEQMGRSHDSLKLLGGPSHFNHRSDQLIHKYLSHRQAHFSVLLRQLGAFYVFNAIAAAGILGYGGWMVIDRQISVGQLVAAEIVVLNLLKACEKLVKSAESFFDLLTGLDKLGHLLEIPVDEPGDSTLPPLSGGCQLRFREVEFRYHDLGDPLLSRLSLTVEANQRVSLIGPEGCGRSTLAQLAVGVLQPDKGQVLVEGLEARRLTQHPLAWWNEREELLDTSVEENIKMGREVSPHDLRWALELSGLHDHLPWLPQGLKTRVSCGGRNLARSQVLRILLARTLLGRPSLLVLDQNLHSLDFEGRLTVVRTLFDRGQRWTLLNLSAEIESLALSDRIYWLQNGQLTELGSPQEAAAQEEGPLAIHSPTLLRKLKRRLEEPQDV